MRSRWGRWHGYMDELEEAMRACGEHLSEVEALLVETYEQRHYAAPMLALAAYAQMQLLLSDYVQHYGLRRKTSENGKPEPVGPQHSWNAPAW